MEDRVDIDALIESFKRRQQSYREAEKSLNALKNKIDRTRQSIEKLGERRRRVW